MECFFPGRVLVGPGPESEGPSYLAEQLTGEFGGDFELEFGIDDVLRQNDVELPTSHVKRTLPFVGRVPEGAEIDIAARLARFPQVASSTPDYLVYPSAPIVIDVAVLDQAVQDLNAQPGSYRCGQGCVVGILDSSVDPVLVPGATLGPKQYDALAPAAPGSTLDDPTGHGSLVARIVSTVAPGAELLSIKTFDRTGTISSVIAALYLAQAAGPCHILNLSMSVSCAPVPCAVCQTPTQAAANIQQLSYFFQTFSEGAPDSVLVAAAGNNTQHLTLPAAFDRVIAVGSFDYGAQSPISGYRHVPADRFVLAPGGQNALGKAFAERPGIAKPEYLHGTSFAAAFITGFAAKTVCGSTSTCGTPLIGQPASAYQPGLLANVLGEIDARADKTWPGFIPAHHGVGAIRF